MSVVRISVKLDLPKMRAIVGGITKEAVERAASVSVKRAKSYVLIGGLIDTGELYASMTSKVLVGDPMRVNALIGTPVTYAKYTEYGTRAHGPVTAPFLVFKPKNSSKWVYTKWVRGIQPRKYMKQTLDRVRPSDFIL